MNVQTEPVAPSLIRPGVSAEMLAKAGVRSVDGAEAHALVGYASAGLVIPYCTIAGDPLTLDGKPFYRLRLRNPTGSAKYLSPQGGGCQLYHPPGLRALLQPGCTLGVVEGEFKAMALVEAGFPTVGIGGITSACPRNANDQPELLPMLAAIINEVRPSKIAFVGDNDTALNPDFAREAIKVAKLVSPIPVFLPRIPLDSAAKGADDLRHALGDEFASRWAEFIATSEKVTSQIEVAELAMRLLQREAASFPRLTPIGLQSAQERLVKFAVYFSDDPLAYNKLIGFAAEHAGIPAATLRGAVKLAAKRKADAEARRVEEEVGKLLSDATAEPPLLFDGKKYFRREDDDTFCEVNREDARLHFGMLGLSMKGERGEPSPADEALYTLQRNHRVNYAGPLCGRPIGVHRENGYKLLATREPKQIVTKAGDYGVVMNLLAILFGRAAGDPLAELQLAIFLSWLKNGRLAFRNWTQHLPGQVLGLIGPADCGKTLVQDAIITPAFGGRVFDPTLWFLGGTTFNDQMWAAEHLGFGDKSLGENAAQRAHLRDELKRVVASSEYVLHPKYGAMLTARPIWRISLSGNDDPESAPSLPALDASFADKIIYLRCYAPPTAFFDPAVPGAREQFWKSITTALPAFLHEVDGMEIPPELAKGRFGIREFHHPHVVSLLDSGSPLNPLGDVLEAYMRGWRDEKLEVALPAVELYVALDTFLGGRLRTIASGPSHLAHQLARLSHLDPWKGRLIREERRIKNRQRQTVWRLQKEAA